MAISLVLYAEYEFNASRRLPAGCRDRLDVYSAIIGAIFADAARPNTARANGGVAGNSTAL